MKWRRKKVLKQICFWAVFLRMAHTIMHPINFPPFTLITPFFFYPMEFLFSLYVVGESWGPMGVPCSSFLFQPVWAIANHNKRERERETKSKISNVEKRKVKKFALFLVSKNAPFFMCTVGSFFFFLLNMVVWIDSFFLRWAWCMARTAVGTWPWNPAPETGLSGRTRRPHKKPHCKKKENTVIIEINYFGDY